LGVDANDLEERHPISARRLGGCRFAALVIMACATGAASAQVPKTEELGTVLFENWLVFTRYTNDSGQWQYWPRFYIPFNLPRGWTFTQRIDLPVAYTDVVGPANPGGAWKSGIGDWFIEEYFTTPEVAKNTTVTASVRFVFPTGGSAPFGSSQYQWAPGIGMNYAIPEHGVTIGPYARYFISYHATREGAARVRTLDLFPTVTFGFKDAWALSFYSENPVVYNDAINKWFVPIDVLLTKRVNKSFGFGVGGAYGLVKDDPRYQYVINGRVTFYF
jgi:hypothetical protein